MKTVTQILFYAVVSTVLLGISNPAYSWVKDISLERVFVGENKRVHEVAVKCRIERKPRSLRKLVSSDGDWCSTELPELCAEQKIAAARKLCSYTASEFRELVVAGGLNQSTPAALQNASVGAADVTTVVASKAELLQEQMLVEERRIRIEQRRIELSRREVALKKELTLMIETASLDAS